MCIRDRVEIAQHAIQEAKAKGYDLVIVDTAGRLAVDEQMMNEITACLLYTSRCV